MAAEKSTPADKMNLPMAMTAKRSVKGLILYELDYPDR